MKKQEIYYELWANLDRARDLAYLLNDDKDIDRDIEVLTILRRKYLNLSGVADKVIEKIKEELKKK